MREHRVRIESLYGDYLEDDYRTYVDNKMRGNVFLFLLLEEFEL